MLQPINLIIGTAWLVAGIVCIALSWPLIAGRIGRNALYGVRFPEAFESDEAWFAINRFGGQRLAWWSIALIACGLAAYFVPLQDNSALTLLVGFAPIVFIFIPMFESWRFAKRFAKNS